MNEHENVRPVRSVAHPSHGRGYPTRRYLFGALLTLGVISSGGDARARDVVDLCVRNSGAVTVKGEGEDCRRNETPLSINVQGPIGPQGPEGPQGPPGEDGTTGIPDGTAAGQVLSWDGGNWIAAPPPTPGPTEEASSLQPYLALNYIIALQGTYPSRSSSEPFLGQIIAFGGNFAPRGWALCDGQLLAIAQNQALFSLLGTTYGGDGRTTFALPDLRGRVPLHKGAGPGLTTRRLGERGGQENHLHLR